MPEATQGGGLAGCAKYGCLGCVVMVGAPILFGVILVVANLAVGVPEQRHESRELTREIPASAVPAELFTDNPGLVRFDVSELEFEIVPGEPGEPIRIEADYDTGSYELTENLTRAGETGWTYDLRFGGRRSLWLRLFSTEDIRNEVRLIIPPGVPFVLEGSMGFGESRLELGGLWVVDADIEFRAGEHDVLFSDPLPVPAGSVKLRGSFGEFTLGRLGNASPAETVITQSAGEMNIDLGGEWRNDATLDVRHRFGEISFHAPDNARVEVDRASLTVGDMHIRRLENTGAPEDAPTLRVSVRSTAGEVTAH